MRFAASVEYIGKKYYGWQSQNNKSTNTIQYHVDKALSLISNHTIKSVCSGRTDTGVNAVNQIIHFDTDAERSSKSWIDGSNSFLPKSIRIKKIYHVDNDFHARFSAISRTYRYFINTNPNINIFNSDYVWTIKDKLIMSRMRDSLKYLRGKNDFSSFRSSGCQSKSAIRNIIKLSMSKRKNIITFEIEANAFLYHMVRNIVGTLIDIGSAKISPIDIKKILQEKDRKACSKMAPANALFLWKVSYPSKYKILLNSESILM